MEEIEFRLVKAGKIVGYERHILIDGIITIQHSKDGEAWFSYGYSHHIKHDEKQPFIGLRYKNGEKIYSGDIINQKYHWPYNYGKDSRGDDIPECTIGVIKWIDDKCGFYIVWTNIFHGERGGLYGKQKKGDEPCRDQFNATYTTGDLAESYPLETIGNVSENSELLA